VTPGAEEEIANDRTWFAARVESEIGPLLDEYWYDAYQILRCWSIAGIQANI